MDVNIPVLVAAAILILGVLIWIVRRNIKDEKAFVSALNVPKEKPLDK